MPAVTAPKRLTVPSENTNLDKDSKETLVCSKGKERGCEITEPKIAAEVRKLQKGSEEVILPLRSKGQRNSARGRKGGGALGARSSETRNARVWTEFSVALESKGMRCQGLHSEILSQKKKSLIVSTNI